MPSAAICWLAAVVLFLIVEASTAALVSIWFVGGSLCAMIAALLGASIPVQLVIFVAVSALMLALLRPFLRNYIRPRIVRTNAARLIGREALVTEAIDNLRETGAVRLDGVLWTAKSDGGVPIAEGEHVTIVRLEGSKVYVSPVGAAVCAE